MSGVLAIGERPGTAFLTTMHFTSARRPAERKLSWVTLMGDAVHVIPPFGAHGGNAAPRDAALLADKIRGAVERGTSLESALTAYEEEMVPCAFKAVDCAAGRLRRIAADGALPRRVLPRAMPPPHRVTVPLPGPTP